MIPFARFICALLIATGLTVAALAQQATTKSHDEDCPLHAQHQAQTHLAEVKRRGAQAMGFSQSKTTHHFRLYADGGAIEVTANRAKDLTSCNQIRRHLQQIAQLFAQGDFSKPQHTHAQVPPGVTVMTQLRAEITYQYEALPRGGRVRISTRNAEALQAVHEFLRFQITDHQTGDVNEVVAYEPPSLQDDYSSARRDQPRQFR